MRTTADEDVRRPGTLEPGDTGSAGKVLTPDRRRLAVEFLIGIWSLSLVRACADHGSIATGIATGMV